MHAYAATAEKAAIEAIYSDPQRPVVVERVNTAGSYAAVLTSGGRMEGSLVTSPILVQRFSFGWQPLDVLEFRCDLESRDLNTSVASRLMRGMPKPRDDRPCSTRPHDAGSAADIATVRRMMRGPLVPYVAVVGDWAMGEWYGGGGGQALYRKVDGSWRLVESGGGAMGVDYMRKYGVPSAAWCAFGITDAKCP